MRQTTTKQGRAYFRATRKELEAMNKDMEGYCFECGEVANIEPDAWKVQCPCCEKPALGGAAEYAMRGIID